MFSYHEINLHLDAVDLPERLSEIMKKPHNFTGHEFQFLNGVKKHLQENLDYESYKSNMIYGIGTCRFNLTQIGLYFLLENEIVFVHTSTLKLNEEDSEWTVALFSYEDIDSFEVNNDYNADHYGSGILYIKLKNAKGVIRSKTIRNINPHHFDYVRDFHEKTLREKHI